MSEYQVGEHIKMPELQFEAGEYAINDWVVSDVNDEVVFIVQHWYNNNGKYSTSPYGGGKWFSASHTGIFKKDLDYSNR